MPIVRCVLKDASVIFDSTGSQSTFQPRRRFLKLPTDCPEQIRPSRSPLPGSFAPELFGYQLLRTCRNQVRPGSHRSFHPVPGCTVLLILLRPHGPPSLI